MTDLKFAIRQLLKYPGFTAVAVLTLAIGIGATTAIYSAIDTTILHPLPVADAHRLMTIMRFDARRGRTDPAVSGDWIGEFKRHRETFTDCAAFRPRLCKYRGGDFVEMVRGAEVSARFFALWQVEALLGRVFVEEDDAGTGDGVVLSHSFWRTRLGADPQVIGKTVELEEESIGAPIRRYTVIGVMPPQFVFPEEDVHYWLLANDWESRNAQVFLRLAAGTTRPQGQQIVDWIASRDASSNRRTSEDSTLHLRPVEAMFVDSVTRQRLWALLAVILLVWLIACSNVASLLIARAEARQREMAVRAVLGAGRVRLLRQMLTESLLLAVAGGACGLVLAAWGIQAASTFVGGIRLRPMEFNVAVLGYAMALSAMTAVVFGLAPAFRASGIRLNRALQQSAASSTQAVGGRYLWRTLIAGEVALAVVALAAAGLMIRSVISVLRLDVGYDPRNVLMAVAIPPDPVTENAADYAGFIQRLGENYAQIPGVQSIGLRTAGGDRAYVAQGDDRVVQVHHEGSGLGERNLFIALRVPLLEGRHLDPSDLGRATVVVNRALATALWPGEKAVGRRFHQVPGQATTSPPNLREGVLLEVVGVVGDVRLDDHEADPKPTLYRPCQDFYRNLHYDRFYLRLTVDSASMIRPVYAAITRTDPGVLHRVIQDVSTELYRSTRGRRHFTLYLALYAAVGLGLAAVGVYGLTAYGVVRRTREFGIRMALGSAPSKIWTLVMQEGAVLATVGLALGLAGALAGTRLLQSQVHGVTARDPLTLGAASAVLVLAVGLASAIPAWRATRIRPMEALRHE